VSTSASSTDRADRVADRLAVPVLIAALASVPAVFLTLFEDPWERLGSGINMVSGAVLVLETVVLLLLAEDRRAWLRRNRWLVGLTIAIIPAVLFAVGPVQLLRLARVAGALRIIRVGRIFKAGRIVRERSGLDQGWQRAIGVGVTLLCAVFVALVLTDPTSSSSQAVQSVIDRVGVLGVVLAGLVLGVATYIVRSDRIRFPKVTPDPHQASPEGHQASPEGHQASPEGPQASPDLDQGGDSSG
jgi:CsoR family transcriptional regulator, copper-sensing transcriptional repressor